MSDIVTSLFAQSAAIAQNGKTATVNVVVLSGYRPSQLVSYAQGPLYYEPPRKAIPPKIGSMPAELASAQNGITQQFSDRTIELPASLSSLGMLQNFAATMQDQLTMTLTAEPDTLLIASTRYNFSVKLALKDDPTTGVVTGDVNGWSYIVMFGTPTAVIPIQ